MSARAGEPGRVAVDGTAGEASILASTSASPAIDRREVHHLGEAEHARLGGEQASSATPSVAPLVASGVAGTQEGAITTMSSGAPRRRVEHEAHAGDAEHVGDLVRVGDDVVGAARHHRARELGRRHRLLSTWTWASIRPGAT